MSRRTALRGEPLDVSPGADRVDAPSAPPFVGWLLAATSCLLAASLAWQWLCVGTYRLYLDERVAPEMSAPVRARQRFDVSGGRVAPQIVSTGDERLSFPVDLHRPSELYLRVVPGSRATFEVAIVERGARRILCRRTLSEAADIAQPLPAMSGVLELANEGELLWSDPRVVQEADVAPALLGLLALLALTGVGLWSGRLVPLEFPRVAWARTALLGGLTAGIAAALCLVVLEVGLRAIGDRLPTWITDPRRNLGEVNTDPRWQDSASYGPRLAPRVNTFCEWEHGDIVRMGYLPSGLVHHPAYRFPFVTDADGFRNSEPESPGTVVAALGDSFTDGMTLPAELTWPARLARLLGVGVRNYGTAGFGPGQELLVLKEYVRARGARLVVVGFFAGNDLVDAERFETFQRDGGAFTSLARGWKFKHVIARFDQLYLTSLYQGASRFLGDREGRPVGPVAISEGRRLRRRGSHRLLGHTAGLRPWPLHRSRGGPRAAVRVSASLPEPADALPATARGVAGMGAHPPVLPGDAPAGSGAGR